VLKYTNSYVNWLCARTLSMFLLSSVLQIRLKHQHSNCEFHFPCDKWIFMPDESVKEDIVLEFPVIRPDVAPIKGSVRHNC